MPPTPPPIPPFIRGDGREELWEQVESPAKRYESEALGEDPPPSTIYLALLWVCLDPCCFTTDTGAKGLQLMTAPHHTPSAGLIYLFLNQILL